MWIFATAVIFSTAVEIVIFATAAIFATSVEIFATSVEIVIIANVVAIAIFATVVKIALGAMVSWGSTVAPVICTVVPNRTVGIDETRIIATTDDNRVLVSWQW